MGDFFKNINLKKEGSDGWHQMLASDVETNLSNPPHANVPVNRRLFVCARVCYWRK